AELAGIEREIPRTIDVAVSYYSGVRAFDAGRYPEALAHYLDAAGGAGEFTRPYRAVLEMYYLLGDAEHAVLYASEIAEHHEKTGDVAGALEYYFAAAQYSIDPLGDPQTAIHLLEKLLRLVESHEKKTGEIAKAKRIILETIDELYATGKYDSFGKVLATRDIRYQMWPGDIETELTRRAEQQARGGEPVLENGKWVKRSVPRPSVLMWRIRARLTLARACARAGRIERALDHYRELLDEYEFLTRHRLYEGKHRDSIRTEAHFMLLRHHAETGRLVRDHALNGLNRLNIADNGLVFTRDFSDRSPDARARVASRYESRGYEYFDFASPPGHQIDSVTLRAKVDGIAGFSFNLP
ncbi:MAG: hypothetical protein GY953_02735, partial [bacterium]|nr:hypothetical protein [bacterium]